MQVPMQYANVIYSPFVRRNATYLNNMSKDALNSELRKASADEIMTL